jgi:dynein heavy chain 2
LRNDFEILLKDLANATGNILENKELLQSLNNTKEKSATITISLEESATLGEDLDKVKKPKISIEFYQYIKF